jgi:hypothetical protein
MESKSPTPSVKTARDSIRRRFLDGSKPEEVLYQNDAYINGAPVDWSGDGKFLSLDLETKDGVFSNWILPLTGEHKLFQPPATSQMTVSEYDGRFSSDGRWLTYFSYETGRPEVYVVPFQAGAKTQVTTTGGWNTIFSRNNELFFVTMGNRLMVAYGHATQFCGYLDRTSISARFAQLHRHQLRRSGQFSKP